MEQFEKSAYELAQSFIDRIPSFGGGGISATQAQQKTQFGLDNHNELNLRMLNLINSSFDNDEDKAKAKIYAVEQINRFANACMPRLR